MITIKDIINQIANNRNNRDITHRRKGVLCPHN